MSIQSERDFKGLAAAGKVVRLAIEAMRSALRPGVTTGELDRIAGKVFAEHGARSAPNMVYGFPGNACISINEEAVHGIPGDRLVREGDLVKLDVTAEKDGYMADAAVTVAVPPVADEHHQLMQCARAALYKALTVAKAGARVNEIGRAVEREVKRSGFAVIRELSGHGIGRSIHEEPSVLNYYDPTYHARLTDGLVITIEPIITTRSGRVVEERDGWTIRTADRNPVAHFEHTMVITKGRPVVLT
jgi:methionyl aminopeptidase